MQLIKSIKERAGELIEKLQTTSPERFKKISIFIQFSLVGALFFGLGILYDQNHIISQKTLKIGQNEALKASVAGVISQNDTIGQPQKETIPKTQSELSFVASKNGTTYYKTDCSNRISEANKIYFKTEEEAQKAGYRRSKTCFK